MADLRSMKKHEMFLSLKRDLALVSVLTFFFFFLNVTITFTNHHIYIYIYIYLKAAQVTHRAKELVNSSY